MLMLIWSLSFTKLKYIMNSPVFTLGKNRTLDDALKLMIKHDIGCVVVTDEGKPGGIITERDILKGFALRSFTKRKKLNDIMTENLKTLSVNDSISEGFKMMQQLRIRRLPLLDEKNNLVGIVTERDIIRAANEYIRLHSRIQWIVSSIVIVGLLIFFLYLSSIL